MDVTGVRKHTVCCSFMGKERRVVALKVRAIDLRGVCVRLSLSLSLSLFLPHNCAIWKGEENPVGFLSFLVAGE